MAQLACGEPGFGPRTTWASPSAGPSWSWLSQPVSKLCADGSLPPLACLLATVWPCQIRTEGPAGQSLPFSCHTSIFTDSSSTLHQMLVGTGLTFGPFEEDVRDLSLFSAFKAPRQLLPHPHPMQGFLGPFSFLTSIYLAARPLVTASGVFLASRGVFRCAAQP